MISLWLRSNVILEITVNVSEAIGARLLYFLKIKWMLSIVVVFVFTNSRGKTGLPELTHTSACS